MRVHRWGGGTGSQGALPDARGWEVPRGGGSWARGVPVGSPSSGCSVIAALCAAALPQGTPPAQPPVLPPGPIPGLAPPRSTGNHEDLARDSCESWESALSADAPAGSSGFSFPSPSHPLPVPLVAASGISRDRGRAPGLRRALLPPAATVWRSGEAGSTAEMFALCPPDAPFPGGPALGTAFSGAMQHGPDANCNFAGDDACDSNQNWSRAAGGGENTANPSDNLLLLAQRQMAQGGQGDVAPSAACAPQQGERSPPEGAEVGEGEAGGSPAEDVGYASSSLSIDSPDSACGNAWDPPGDPPEAAEPPPEPLFPALAEAVQQLQEKERFKEREKEKHHVQLVMYRRLALLRWIHGLQQKVLEQQDRLQESFDTILDNRKELIRCMQQGVPCPAAAAAPSP